MAERTQNITWRLVPTLAWRELRHGLRGFRVFLACLILGVTAITAVGLVSQSVVGGLQRDGGKLLGGDLDLRLLHRPVSPEQETYLRDESRAYSAITELRSMARPVDRPENRAMVEVKAVDKAYPLNGELVTEPASPLGALLENRDGIWGAVVDANLLTRLKIKTGDVLRVGAARFQIRATVVTEPDRVANVFSFGPRLMIAADAVPETNLIQPGSQVHYHYRVLLPAQTSQTAWTEAVNAAFPKAGWRIRGTDEAAPGVRRFIDRMTLFMTFTGLTILLVGGIGIAGAVTAYLDTKTATLATLKCLGAPGELVFRIYLLQVMAVAAVGILIGIAAGTGLPAALIGALGSRLPVEPQFAIYPAPLIVAVLFGFLVAGTFALLPLARARDVPAAALFRHAVQPPRGRPRMGYLVAAGAGVAALAGLTIATATDRYFALWFVGGAALTLIVLRLGALAVMAGAAKWGHHGNAVVRMVFANLHRPGAATPGVFLSLGLGLAVLVAVALIEGNLGRQISERLPERAPAFFFIDIQPHQVAAFDAAVTNVDQTSGFQRVPTLRGRIVKIAGVDVEDATVAPESQWAIRGDRALTYSAEKRVRSAVVAGEWWPTDYTGPPIISLDAGLARGFGVGLGDTLTLNVLGREITAKITSLREIDWRSLRFDFAIVFAPGTLEGAPHTHIAAIEAPVNAENAVEKAATDAFPNVSAIRVRDALEAAARILAGVGWAVRGTAALTLVAGAIVLAGAIAAGHRRRVAESVVFKVLGASRRRVLGVYLLEYGLLGILTSVIGAAVGTLTAWAVVVHLMGMEWAFLPAQALGTAIICVALTIGFGLLGTGRALALKPAPLLRNE